ncbi:condensation domain-containing protein [Nonomuraea ferruginea]
MLMPIVHRLAELGGRISRLNQAELLRTPAGMTREQVAALVRVLVDRHDALRSRLSRLSPLLWSLEARAAGDTPDPGVLAVDATGLGDDGLSAVIAAESDAAADRLDPDAGRMVEAVWFDRGPDRQGRLLIVAHHLVVDGVSWRILAEDLRQAWEAVSAGERPVLDPVGTSLRAHARSLAENAAQAARLAEFEHWTATLRPGGELDPSATTAGLTVGATRDHVLRVPGDVTGPLLTTVPGRLGVDVTEALVAALRTGVARWRAARGGDAGAPLVIDLERHGREGDADLSRTVGWFTAIAPVRLPGGSAGPAEVRRAVRAAPDGGLGFGLLRYCNPPGPRPRSPGSARPSCSSTTSAGSPSEGRGIGTRRRRPPRCAWPPTPTWAPRTCWRSTSPATTRPTGRSCAPSSRTRKEDWARTTCARSPTTGPPPSATSSWRRPSREH